MLENEFENFTTDVWQLQMIQQVNSGSRSKYKPEALVCT